MKTFSVSLSLSLSTLQMPAGFSIFIIHLEAPVHTARGGKN